MSVTRAGEYVRQITGYEAFIPAPLPPDPPLVVDSAMQALLSAADQAIGRLDGVCQVLPDPNLFVAMYVRQEAVLSSQIEGTQSTLEDVLDYELEGRANRTDVREVVNYVAAMDHGLARLDSLPLSLRLIREIHGILLADTRGAERQPGEFRRTQNWIGPGGATLGEATFVPPPPDAMRDALAVFETFLHEESLPALVHAGLAHAQFETIHPFLDGNGRVGRLLITFLLMHRQVLQQPLLYLSVYLKRHRAEYYDRLMAIREDGNWEGWMAFFLRGIAETATEAAETARAIIAMQAKHRAMVENAGLGSNGMRLLDRLFVQPRTSVRAAGNHIGVSPATANKLVAAFVDLGLLEETTGRRRDRRFEYAPYVDLFGNATSTDTSEGSAPADETITAR